MIIDSHAHLNFNAYKNDVDEVVRRSLDNNVWMINVGSNYETSKRAVEIAERYEKGVYAAIGLHPIHLSSGIFKTKIDKEEVEFETKEEEFDSYKYKNLALGKNLDSRSTQIRELAKSEKVVAIGEIGLDYYYRPKTKIKLGQFKEKQKEVFLKQLELAKELDLPVIFHCRMAHNELIDILKSEGKNIKGVVHCFTGDQEQTEKYLEMGFYLGLNGIIFRFSQSESPRGPAERGIIFNLDKVIKKMSLDRILIETDCPYLTPPPMSGRNEPIYVKYVAEKIAKLKNLSYEEIRKITTQNAKKLFKI